MAVLTAEVRNIDYRQRIGGLDADACARSQISHVLAGLEHRKRAFQTAKVQRALVATTQLLLQIFQNGLSGCPA